MEIDGDENVNVGADESNGHFDGVEGHVENVKSHVENLKGQVQNVKGQVDFLKSHVGHGRLLLDAYGDSLKTVALMLWKVGVCV